MTTIQTAIRPKMGINFVLTWDLFNVEETRGRQSKLVLTCAKSFRDGGNVVSTEFPDRGLLLSNRKDLLLDRPEGGVRNTGQYRRKPE